jgi:deferrochelatase/peroxidase EfeB
MKGQADAERPFNDPPSSQWDTAFQGEVHALLILAHDDRRQLTLKADQFQAKLLGCSKSAWRECGSRLEFEFPTGKKTIEHFGYEDVISNPFLILQDVEKEHVLRGFDQWDGAAPLRNLRFRTGQQPEEKTASEGEDLVNSFESAGRFGGAFRPLGARASNRCAGGRWPPDRSRDESPDSSSNSR